MSEILATSQEAEALTGPGTWRVSWAGVRTVAVLELRQRVRSTRWILILVLWAVLLGALTALMHLYWWGWDYEGEGPSPSRFGAAVFGMIVYMVLSLGSLIAPAMASTSINGDRAAGVLATPQTTLLTPAEIALGKLGAAWVTSLAFLVVSLPIIGWGYLDGGTPLGRLAVTSALLAVMLLVVCAVGLGWSAITARTTYSVVLTYLTVAAVGIGLPVLYVLLIPVTATTERHVVRTLVPQSATMDPRTGQWVEPSADGRATTRSTGEDPLVCRESVRRERMRHPERIWWVLAANPYVILADASPLPPDHDSDMLSEIRRSVRELRQSNPSVSDHCDPDEWHGGSYQARGRNAISVNPTWPYGLAANLALGAGFTAVAVLRLRTPMGRLPRGLRIA
jgi:ABC-type transport system involved in multi-copper enzyme maturation permease subunit